MEKRRVNWHEAAVCAMQIELRDYSHLLEFYPEYVLGKNNYRIDLLIIQKLLDMPILKKIARIFKNTRQNISLSFLSTSYPRKLFKHLTKDCKLMIEKFSPGVYYISNEMYQTQVLVTKELSPEENLYLCCLSKEFQDVSLKNKLSGDYSFHQDQDIYIRYMNQITNASINSKGESTMVCEGILNICGTSSKEIIKATKEEAEKIYVPQINELTKQNEYLKSLLEANGIAY